MIELKNIEKSYKSKKGKKNKVLDNISLNFDTKGMTFILGKSGSGKSTLLNIIGGLDKYDSGDMLLSGKSSKDFSQADLDSYRNTYIGFIFQEFNLLEDYDVYENILIALQLQKKNDDDGEIEKILKKLEISDLKSRKVNELSGGQKQRVAIARALIKNPKIILADEPTGNLDSTTGTQVMDLLKEISKEKLVIIVSHDEEFARKYGDRIVEIKDGKILSDTKEVKSVDKVNEYKAVKSKLPLKDSFKLGIGSLKHKKVKLVFTILLTIASLGFFSMSDTLSSYNYNKEHAKLLEDEKEQFVEVQKYYILNDDGYIEKQLVEMNDEVAGKIKDEISTPAYDVYNYYGMYDRSSVESILHVQQETGIQSYDGYYDNAAEIVVCDDLSKIQKEEILGRSADKKEEIVISSAVADKIIKNGVEVHEVTMQNEFKTSNIFKPQSYEEILNTQYNYYFGEEGKTKIVGIILHDEKSSKKENIVNKIYVSEKFISESEEKQKEDLKSYFSPEITIENKEKNENDYYNVAVLDHELEYFDGNQWKKTSKLNKNEVVLNINDIVDYSKYSTELDAYLNRNGYRDYENLEKRFFENYINEMNIIGRKLDLNIYYSMYGMNRGLYASYNGLNIVGVYNRDTSYTYNSYFSSELLGDIRIKNFERSSVLYPMTSRSDFENILKKFPYREELTVKSSYSRKIEYEKGIFDSLKKISMYVSIVFLVFSVILIMNFMITSISYRKKEIGVLRALGSRSMDVGKIFLWEGIILSIISGTIASFLLVIVTNVLNGYIKSELSIVTTPFLIGIRQFAVIYAVVFLVVIISSIIPIRKISKMKPIDAILNK